MKKTRKALTLILALGMFISLLGCSLTGNEKFNVVTHLQTQKLCVAFRLGDMAGDSVVAALLVLQAEGKVASVSREWFNDDLSMLKGNENALNELGTEIGERTFIVGYDPGHLPYSGLDKDGNPMGFDIDLARAVCDKLGWKVKFLPVDVANAETELSSGNVDCVWGGYAMEEGNTKLSYSPAYMENSVIIASLSDSGVRSERGLEGKTLAVSGTGQLAYALEANPDAVERLEYIVRLPGGADECFAALAEGSCDAIVTDMAAIEYYN